jgi:hypothetical protein
MIVRRLVVDDHEVLREMSAFLDTVEAPPPPYDTRGDWLADIDAGPPPVDRPQPLAFRRQFMPAPVRVGSMADDTIVSALNYYPPGGAGIGWHTDSGHAGWRIYIARPLAVEPGVLLVYDGAERETHVLIDTPGIAAAFYVSGRPCDSWHAVRTFGPRLSIGLRIAGARTARAMGLE